MFVGLGAFMAVAMVAACGSEPPKAQGLTAPAQKVADLAYAETSPAQKLDLYLPARHGDLVPLVVYVHGGAFMGGDKGDELRGLPGLLDAGIAMASVNYRLSGEATFPAGGADVFAAVRWLKAHAADYGIDPDRFGAWGDSAGATLVSLLGTVGDQKSVMDDAGLGNEGISSAVRAVVDFYGPSDFRTMDAQAKDPGGCAGTPQVHDEPGSPESLWLGAPVQESPAAEQASPITYIAGNDRLPAFYIAHGTADCNVPHAQSTQLAEALKAKGGEVTLTLVDGALHADPEIWREHTDPAIAFLEAQLAR